MAVYVNNQHSLDYPTNHFLLIFFSTFNKWRILEVRTYCNDTKFCIQRLQGFSFQLKSILGFKVLGTLKCDPI